MAAGIASRYKQNPGPRLATHRVNVNLYGS